jgi:hypothetical protein
MRWMIASIALCAPMFAAAAPGELGVTLGEEAVGPLGTFGPRAGTVTCVGGLGYRVQEADRTGLEASLCGNVHTFLTYGGVQIGKQVRPEPFWLGAYSGFGLGWVDATREEDRYRSMFLYAKPTLAVGHPVQDKGAIEAGVYAMIPLPVVQSIRGDGRSLATFPHMGLQVTWLFGNFTDSRSNPEPVPALPPG